MALISVSPTFFDKPSSSTSTGAAVSETSTSTYKQILALLKQAYGKSSISRKVHNEAQEKDFLETCDEHKAYSPPSTKNTNA